MRTLFLAMALLSVSGCGWSFPFIPKPPEKHFQQVETEVRDPRYVIGPDGKVWIVVDHVEKTYQVGLQQSEPKIPGWKRVWQALWGWGGLLAVLLTGLGFLGVPVLPILFMLFRRIRSSNKHLNQIVASVNDGLDILPADQQAAFKAELSKTQDTDTKKAVARIKGEG